MRLDHVEELIYKTCDNCQREAPFEQHENKEFPQYNWERCLYCQFTFVGEAWLKKWKMTT